MAKLPGDSLPVSKKSKCRPWIVKVKNTGCGSNAIKKVKAPAIVKAICDWKDKGTKGTKSSAQNSCLELDNGHIPANPISKSPQPHTIKQMAQTPNSKLSFPKNLQFTALHFAFSYHFPDWDPILLPFLRFFKKSLFLRTTFSLWDRILARRVYCLEQCFFVMVTSCDSVSFYWLRATS